MPEMITCPNESNWHPNFRDKKIKNWQLFHRKLTGDPRSPSPSRTDQVTAEAPAWVAEAISTWAPVSHPNFTSNSYDMDIGHIMYLMLCTFLLCLPGHFAPQVYIHLYTSLLDFQSQPPSPSAPREDRLMRRCTNVLAQLIAVAAANCGDSMGRSNSTSSQTWHGPVQWRTVQIQRVGVTTVVPDDADDAADDDDDWVEEEDEEEEECKNDVGNNCSAFAHDWQRTWPVCLQWSRHHGPDQHDHSDLHHFSKVNEYPCNPTWRWFKKNAANWIWNVHHLWMLYDFISRVRFFFR